MCGDKFSNVTVSYHECLCQFNYASQKRKMGVLKYKHCAMADEIRRQMDFDMYKIIGFSCLIFVVVAIVLFCSFKWYQQTNKNPCSGCCSCLCGCNNKKKKPRRRPGENGLTNRSVAQDAHDSSAGFDENWVHDMNADVGSFHQNACNGGANNSSGNHDNRRKRPKNTLCMKFCLSEPVQDCCEFFDCDIMWRKKNVYSQPYFGRNKKNSISNGVANGGELNGGYGLQIGASLPYSADDQEPSTLQRRPTRPAPPPPQLPGMPGSAKHHVPIFDDGTLITEDDIICEPVPEAPPSPEPVRVQQPDLPRSIYVDPLAFLQRPFLRLSIALSGKESGVREGSKDEDEPDALYSRVKDFVMSKVRKAGSVASLNRAGGVDCHGVSTNPDGDQTGKNKYGKTGSLASLHDITESELDKNYPIAGGSGTASKRSMSLASLHMLDNTLQSNLGPSGNPSRNASRDSLADDVPPNQRDEYIDLEEMARKMAARMQQQQQNQHQLQQMQQIHHAHSSTPAHAITSQPLSVQALQRQQSVDRASLNTSATSQASPVEGGRTPDFIPASAYAAPSPQPPKSPVPVLDQQYHQQMLQHQRSALPATSVPYEIGPSVLYPPNESNAVHQSSVPTVSGNFSGSYSHHNNIPSNGNVFSQSNYASFQQQQQQRGTPTSVANSPPHQASPRHHTASPYHASSPPPPQFVEGRPCIPARPAVAVVKPSTPSPVVSGVVVPYNSSSLHTMVGANSSTPNDVFHNTQHNASSASIASTPSNTLGRTKPSVPPRPSVISDNPHYRSLGRGNVGPASPKINHRVHHTSIGAIGNPLIVGKPTVPPPLPPLSLHEQQLLQQQLIQQQHMQQLYLQQQQAHLSPAATMQQLLLQQQLQEQQHTIMTPAVQQQMLQEHQMYQQLLHHQMQQQYQQHLQQQLLQQQFQHHGMSFRQPLSSNSSTGSTESSFSSRSTPGISKPNHPPPPPPSGGGLGGAPIESSI